MRRNRGVLSSVLGVCAIALAMALRTSSGQERAASPPAASGQPEKAGAGRAVPQTLKLELGKGVTMELVLVPAGEFMMGSRQPIAEAIERYGGSKDDYVDEYPRHRVRITRPFYMGKYEVTVGQFKRFVEDTNYVTDAEKGTKDDEDGRKGGHVTDAKGPAEAWSEDASFRNPGFKQTDDHPVVLVSWNDATAFCKWLAKRSARAVRLPTEAEWEYACRAGTETAYWWGDEMDRSGKVANVLDEAAAAKWPPKSGNRAMPMKDGYIYTSPVGRFKANALGLHDMAGNVCEWCGDWGAPYPESSQTDPTGPARGMYRIVRGGGWGSTAGDCRCAVRGGDKPGYRDDSDGFRVAAGT